MCLTVNIDRGKALNRQSMVESCELDKENFIEFFCAVNSDSGTTDSV